MTRIDWDAADTFDDEPDHGLRDPAVRRAWAERMRHWLPPAPSDVLDLGRGPYGEDTRATPARRGEDARAAPARHSEVVDVHLVLRRGDEVLLARRAGTGYGDGLWNGPSGHVEDGEDVRAAMVREAREEIGVEFAPEDLRVALVMQHRGPGDPPRTGWFFEADGTGGGEPYNREPHKCSELAWHPLAALPDDMVAYCRAGFEAYRRGERFVLHWHEDDDPIAHDPGLPDRAVPLPTTRVSPAAG
ncbi:NUDIX hydrolase [Streptomyces sp. WMMC940]|uniref:NUDIX hydrolase n=1 Tax=Streptomyces sp. WMMC940 TaxID=3015153 RepID=UPI0022B6A7EB|nr:NUDIX domain-containing protein [Streptomyces sp. WMMC940]MCZ7461226.1 NUDIX domain-containing protein [Streptomyces sp. WMMC940]